MIAFLLGVVLGNILQGFALGPNFSYKGGIFFSFLNPYAIMVGFTTLSLFMTQGAIYLLLKTEGTLHQRLTFLLRRGMIFFIVSFGITSLYTLIFIPGVAENFRSNPIYFAVPVISFLFTCMSQRKHTATSSNNANPMYIQLNLLRILRYAISKCWRI